MEQEQKPTQEELFEKARKNASDLLNHEHTKRFVVFGFNDKGETSGAIQCGTIDLVVVKELVEDTIRSRVLRKKEIS